jgi:hypothetical protein
MRNMHCPAAKVGNKAEFRPLALLLSAFAVVGFLPGVLVFLLPQLFVEVMFVVICSLKLLNIRSSAPEEAAQV